MLQNQAQDLNEMAEEAQDLSRVEQETIELAEARERAVTIKGEKAQQLEAELFVCVGRIQASKAITTFAEWLTVSQLRRIKGLAKEAGKTWRETCEHIGISTKTADQYLRLGEDLGDSFVADMSAIGVSIRALEAARRLPEEVRQRLISGEVLDLEVASKEELTEVIKDLAREHGKELATKDEALTKETKAREKAEAKAKDVQQRLDATTQELANLKAGLPEDDEEAMQIIRDIEHKILPHLAVIMLTKMQGRSPKAVSRITASLELIRAQAEWAHRRLCLMAEGGEFDDAELNQDARYWADEIARGGEPRPVI